jgi:hypothetical protein
VGSPYFLEFWWFFAGAPTSSSETELTPVEKLHNSLESKQSSTYNTSTFNDEYLLPKTLFFEYSIVTLQEKNKILFIRELDSLQRVIDQQKWELEAFNQAKLFELAEEHKNRDIAAAVELRNVELLKLRIFAQEQVILRNNIAQLQSLLQNETESIQLEKLQLAKQEHCMLSLVTKLQGASYSILSSQDTTPAERILASEKLLSRLSFCKEISFRLEQQGNALTQRDNLHQVDLENFHSHFGHLVKESSLKEGKRNNAPVL